MAARRTIWLATWAAALAPALLGCVSSPETVKTDGSYLTGGSGRFGADAGLAARKNVSLTSGKQPPRASSRLHLAYAQLKEREGELGEARKSYNAVLESNPKSVDALVGLARLEHLAGRFDAAEEGFRKAAASDQNGTAHDALGQFLAERGRMNEALAAIDRALAMDPYNRTFAFHHAILLAKAGNLQQAFPELVNSVGLAAAYYNIGVLLHERNDLAGSEQYFTQALVHDPSLEPAQQWLLEVRREREMATRGRNPPAGDAVSSLARSNASPLTAPSVQASPATGRVLPASFETQAAATPSSQ
jgi:Tfp pilus assembly protein PilF